MGNNQDDSTRDIILNRRDGLLRERRKLREQRQQLAMRDREIDRDLADCRAAARVFGLTDIEFPPDEREEFMRIRAIENRLLHDGERTRARTIDSQPSLPSLAKTDANQVQKIPRIKDIVLDRLKAAGVRGEKAAAIKQYIESTYSTEIHEKTVGMTLYRLSISQEKPVRREGQMWFFVPKNGETKNPAVDAAGQLNRGK